jgi:hypothetical protein
MRMFSSGDELPREGSRWLLRSPASRCRGEQGISTCAAVGRVRVRDSVRGGLGERQETAPRLSGRQAQCQPRGRRPELRSGGSRARRVQGGGSRPTGRCGTSVWERTPLGGCRGGRTTYAAAAQCKRATADQRTIGRAASQARREYAAAQARPLGKAGSPTGHGTWVGGVSGYDQRHEPHRQPGHS